MLSSQLAHQATAIRINCDEEGMAKLIKALQRIRADGDQGDLRIPLDNDLDENNPWGEKAIYQVVLSWVGD
jgi:hypothetical protein